MGIITSQIPWLISDLTHLNTTNSLFQVYKRMKVKTFSSTALILTFWVDPNCTTPCGATEITAIVCKLDWIVINHVSIIRPWETNCPKDYQWFASYYKCFLNENSTLIPEENWRRNPESSCWMKGNIHISRWKQEFSWIM